MQLFNMFREPRARILVSSVVGIRPPCFCRLLRERETVFVSGPAEIRNAKLHCGVKGVVSEVKGYD